MINAFITGSFAYGSPTSKSDLDLVLLVDADDQVLLQRHSDEGEVGPVRYGRLNLIPVTNPKKFEAWRVGTEKLMAEATATGEPISRDYAVSVLTALRAVAAGEAPSDR